MIFSLPYLSKLLPFAIGRPNVLSTTTHSSFLTCSSDLHRHLKIKMIVDASNKPLSQRTMRTSSSSQIRRVNKAKQRRLKEYRKLSNLVPSLASVVTPSTTLEDVTSTDEVIIVNETMKYIEQLEQRLMMKLKDPQFLERLMSLESSCPSFSSSSQLPPPTSSSIPPY